MPACPSAGLDPPTTAPDAIAMTFEARLGFLLFFFLVWTILGLIPWAVVAVANRGRGAEWALPVAVVSACAAGVLVPTIGLRDFTGFVISWFTALAGSAAGSLAATAVWRRNETQRAAAAGDSASDPAPVPAPADPALDRPAPPSLD